MALPESQFTPTPVEGNFFPPDDRLRTSLLVDYEDAGIDIGDPSEGLQYQFWEARVAGGVIQTRPEAGGAWYDITSAASITEISLAFDQNMRPQVAYVAGGVVKFYWFDSAAEAYVTSTFAGATSPVCAMDDKREREVGLNDVVLFYLLDGRVIMRRQRDRYSIAYDMAAVPSGTTRIVRWGMTDQMRFQLEFGDDPVAAPVVAPDAGETTEPVHGDAYTSLVDDEMFVVDGTDIVPFFAGATNRTGLWRSKIIPLDEHPPFAWIGVEGCDDDGVTVRIYADGELWFEDTLVNDDLVRLPAGQHREWQIEAESSERFSRIVLAGTAAESRV